MGSVLIRYIARVHVCINEELGFSVKAYVNVENQMTGCGELMCPGTS